MDLSCECDFDKDDSDSWYYFPKDFSKLKTTRRKRCLSCKKLIDINSTVVSFDILRHPNSEIEERCKGEEIEMASKYMCERCGEIYLTLLELGYCIDIFEYSMENYLKDYQKMTGFKSGSRARQ